ncbi:homoserine kinase [Intrasporangium calvum]|uniref:Homoserine kinase n=1 Tax=Intrasporangium calvum (strain ATCC 23552 / DSM 43043 / JCM 3097 / NBRC 12989 / NCIMB 10167 / NRRL B-3866 / 7 KIP) TaxID=710696 RepID=E6S6G9_INTC7|nr:homoserine kinase [Intrasporangium calvum]ADU48958.1 homoserine kinase [Intrasporangium calvum DSM 43043]
MTSGTRSVRIRVPASTANLGPGFDSIGLALGLWDEYVATTLDVPGLEVQVTGEGAADVPRDESHLVVRTMRHTWRTLGLAGPAGLRLSACNGVPHGRGLGSSATAIVAGVVGAQALSYAAELAPGAPVPVDLRLASHLASVLEGHPDNASASVFGGLTVSWMPDGSGADLGALTVSARPVLHPEIDVVAFVPDQQLATRHARAVLPSSVPLKDAAANSGRAALLVHALTTEPVHLHAATRDWLHQEPRRASYPDSMRLVDALRSQGHAAVVSGAGPTVLVLTTRARLPEVVAPAGMRHWVRLTPGIPSEGVTAVVAG